MNTLLQTLLIETLPEDTDPILRSFIDTVLPALEREFAFITALGGSESAHYEALVRQGEAPDKARKTARSFATKPDQSLLVHVLNALLVAWNLSETKQLPKHLRLSAIEKRLLCLGITLHDYDKAERGQKEEATTPPKAHEIPRILQVCEDWGERLNFQEFWSEWKEYLLDIAYLAQNTQFSRDSSPIASLWEQASEREFNWDDRCLDQLRHLLAFGDIAVHMNDPADIVTTTKGDRLQDHLDMLGVSHRLTYHRLRDCRGLLTNQIHNAAVNFACEIEWQPILYFAQGAVYLAPINSPIPDFSQLQSIIWEIIIQGDEENNQKGLSRYFEMGDIGFVRDGKGLKVAPQTLEIFNPAELIRLLPDVIKAKVTNSKDPATRKRLEKLTLKETDKERLMLAGDIRADRIAEFLILTQKEFFEGCEAYAPQVLNFLGLSDFAPEQTAVQSGGVNYGWYHAAACYMADHASLEPEQVLEVLVKLANRIVIWAEENHLLQARKSPTKEAFFDYLQHYLEFSISCEQTQTFEQELVAYTTTKTTNQPICSLSSGEAVAEDQLDSVVLFKPQQYSNKNSLGGRRIKRGISKIWSLEMLLRQAYWSAPSGKLEDKKPIFLYIFPAYVYSPQVARAVKLLVKEWQKTNLWEVRKQWLEADMNLEGLQNLFKRDAIAGDRESDRYSTRDLPFMAITYTTTRGKTTADAWVEPAFQSLVLPLLLGVKVVATPSPEPLYASDKEFSETVKLDGAASFWGLLGLEPSLRVQDLQRALERLLIAYSLHLDNRAKKPDPRWQAFNGTARDLVTDVLNIFAIANEGLRRDKREPTSKEVERYWKYAQLWAKGDKRMERCMEFTEKLVREYRKFYQVGIKESSHSILLPLTKALEIILANPDHIKPETLIWQGAGQLHDAIQRQETYKRPLIMDKLLEPAVRYERELEAIQAFMTTCVKEVFLTEYKGDRALLQENRNRIKSGAEFAYRWLELQEKQAAN